jgi:hypothetical protein
MLHKRNTVVNFYRIRLTGRSFLNSLSSNIARVATVAFAAIVVSAAGCAVMDSRPDAEVVKERAQARWNALVRGDFTAAYGYLSPVGRSSVKAEDYVASLRKGFWKSATVDRVECPSSTLCEAHLTIEYQHMGRSIKTPLKESWLKDGTTWWYVLK